MKLLDMSRLLLGVLLLATGLALASAEELVGTPVPLGDDSVVPMEASPPPPPPTADAPSSPPSDWSKKLSEELDRELHGAFHDHGVFHDIEKMSGQDKDFNTKLPVDNDMVTILGGFAVFVIAVLVLGWPFFLSIYLVTLHYRAKSQRRRDLNANIDKLLAAGRDIPVEILRGDEPRQPDESGNRDKGIRNLFLGTGWLIFLTIFFGIDIGAVGFIWIALGLSQLVIWKLNNPAANTQPQASQQD